jgi:uncharacterized protein
VLAVPPANVAAVVAHFRARGIASADIGEICADPRVAIADGASVETIWDFAREPLIGCTKLPAFA